MSRSKTLLIVAGLGLLLILVVIVSRTGDRDAANDSESSGLPSFKVRVEKPLSARPLFGLFGLLPPGYLGFDQASPGAQVGRVGHDRLELVAQGWDLSIETDGDGGVAAGTRLLFTLELGGSQQSLRCLPAAPAVGHLEIVEQGDPGEFGGRFRLELATCENAATGRQIEWPPAPLTVLGSFDRLRGAPAERTDSSEASGR